jgi:hypothetical protein
MPHDVLTLNDLSANLDETVCGSRRSTAAQIATLRPLQQKQIASEQHCRSALDEPTVNSHPLQAHAAHGVALCRPVMPSSFVHGQTWTSKRTLPRLDTVAVGES